MYAYSIAKSIERQGCMYMYIVTIEVALVALKSKLEVKMSVTKLPSCVTVKT